MSYILKAATTGAASSSDYNSNNNLLEDTLFNWPAGSGVLNNGGLATTVSGLTVAMPAYQFRIGIRISKAAQNVVCVGSSTCIIWAVANPSDPELATYQVVTDGSNPTRATPVMQVVTGVSTVTSISYPSNRNDLWVGPLIPLIKSSIVISALTTSYANMTRTDTATADPTSMIRSGLARIITVESPTGVGGTTSQINVQLATGRTSPSAAGATAPSGVIYTSDHAGPWDNYRNPGSLVLPGYRFAKGDWLQLQAEKVSSPTGSNIIIATLWGSLDLADD